MEWKIMKIAEDHRYHGFSEFIK